MQAFIYIRFSTTKQERGASRERQLELCRDFCERRGWPVEAVLEDLGRSAWTGAHLTSGELGRFAERVRDGEVGPGAVLVVEKVDRLSRQEARKTLRWMEDLCAAGLTIATVDGNRVYDDAGLRADLMGVFEILMRAKLANDESQQKSDRVLDRIARNMQRAQDTGQVITAKAPGWLVARADRTGFDIVKERAALVVQIYEMAAEGMGARWIAKELNERGHRAWGKWRKPGSTPTWEISAVKMILSQPSVEGDYVPGFSNTGANRTKFDKRIVGYYPRIVDADLVARARSQVDARKTGPRTGGRHTTAVANLFASVVFCGECGNRMHLRSSGGATKKQYWQCNFAARSRGCGQKALFPYAPFERAALDRILHLALDDRQFSRPEYTGALATKVAELSKSISDKAEQAANLADVLARLGGSTTIEAKLLDAERAIRDLTIERDTAIAALDAARGAVSPSEHLARVRDVREAMDDEDAEVRRAARLRVQKAIIGLGCRVTCDVDPEHGREIGLFLRGGVLGAIFSLDGRIVQQFDGLAFVRHLYPDADEGEIAARAMAILGKAVAREGEFSQLDEADEPWFATISKRGENV